MKWWELELSDLSGLPFRDIDRCIGMIEEIKFKKQAAVKAMAADTKQFRLVLERFSVPPDALLIVHSAIGTLSRQGFAPKISLKRCSTMSAPAAFLCRR